MRARHYRSIRVSTPAHSSGSTCCSSNSHSSLAISRWLLMPNMITAFDSGNGALLDANRIDSVALVAACGLAAGTALPIPAVPFGPAIRTLRNGRVARTAVSSLLPGRESDFVLCPGRPRPHCFRWRRSRTAMVTYATTRRMRFCLLPQRTYRHQRSRHDVWKPRRMRSRRPFRERTTRPLSEGSSVSSEKAKMEPSPRSYRPLGLTVRRRRRRPRPVSTAAIRSWRPPPGSGLRITATRSRLSRYAILLSCGEATAKSRRGHGESPSETFTVILLAYGCDRP